MAQTIGEYIEQDATFKTLNNNVYYYVYVDIENDNKEILIASYNSRLGELDWENNKYSRYIANNVICEFTKRERYTCGNIYENNSSDYIDVLMYSVPAEEIENFNV